MIPDFEKLMRPLLEYASDGKIHSINDAENHLAEKFDITMEQREERKPSGREPKFLGRIRWARLYLKKAGLIFDPKEAHYRITEDGKKFLENNPEVNTKILLDIPQFKKWYTKDLKKPKPKLGKPNEGRGVVILIDFLGTKGLEEKMTTREIIEQWREFTKEFEDQIVSRLRSFDPRVSFNAFSDTIIITAITNNTHGALQEFSETVSSFILESMIIGRPMRGCFSVGKIIRDDTLIIGNAISEASKYYELPQWIGISASPSAHKEIENFSKIKKSALNLQQFDIPLKKSVELDAWAINWPQEIKEDTIERLSKTHKLPFREIYQVFSDLLEKAAGNIEGSLKIRNTMAFYDEARS